MNHKKINVVYKNGKTEDFSIEDFIKIYFFSTDFNKAFINLLDVLDKNCILNSNDLKNILRTEEIEKRDCSGIEKINIEYF